ncbi:MAG: hypothetical protein F6J87_10025 [Spirulina sp. SIO3F2]|nr:hypothetical protein [Spirulina sp. SIO3F2]
MISPDEIKQKAERQYSKFLTSVIEEGDNFFPLEFPVGKVPSDYPALRDAVTKLLNQAKVQRGYGYHLELVQRNTRRHGMQSLPTKVWIDNEADYLRLLRKAKEVERFRQQVRLTLRVQPQLKPWLSAHPKKVIEYSNDWEALLDVCHYFQRCPRPNLYIRELPIRVHTKFIEQHKSIIQALLEAILPPEQLVDITGEKDYRFEKRLGLKYREPLVRLRILDPMLRDRVQFSASDLSLPLSEFAQLNLAQPQCWLTENLMNFLTLPPLAQSIGIFGSGYAVGQLKAAAWLQDCPIFYWGDLDVDGFKILSQLRSHFPQTLSVMMDQRTLETFQAFVVADTRASLEKLPHLTAAEQQLYEHLATTQQRLEQEHIHQRYVNAVLHEFSAGGLMM